MPAELARLAPGTRPSPCGVAARALHLALKPAASGVQRPTDRRADRELISSSRRAKRRSRCALR